MTRATPRNRPRAILARVVLPRWGMPDDARQILGKSGEDLACAELQRLGYAILERRYRTRYGEIDIVASDGETTVFVEVKTRAGDTYGGGADAVTAWKQRRIAQMAVDFLSRRRLHDRPCRFDVVVVDLLDPGHDPRIVVYRSAFDAPF
jgi:putative endonuclease